MAIRLRSPWEAVPPLDFNPPYVRIRHPDYPDENNELLGLVATDGASDEDGPEERRYGIQLHVVHTACAIITGNRFDGVLESCPGTPSVPSESTALLHAGDYYFRVPSNPNNPYPVVPNFRSWQFPTEQFTDTPVLSGWRSTEIATVTDDQAAKERDVSCRLTGQRECAELAHIVPNTEDSWFMANNMDRGSFQEGKDAMKKGNENLILLRSDVHTIWDRSDLSIVPKKDGTSGWEWTVHVLKRSGELHHLYHNRPLRPLKAIDRKLLLARFAYDVFPKLRGFLQRGVTRWVLSGGTSWAADATERDKFCENQGRHRSSSPRKSKARSPAKRAREDDEHDEREEQEERDEWDEWNKRDERDKQGERKGEDEYSEHGDSGISLPDDRGSEDGSSEDDDPYGDKRRAEQADLEEQRTRGRKRRRV